MVATDTAEAGPGRLSIQPARWCRFGVPAGLASAAVIGIPTDVIDNPWFSRMTPVLWWEYPALIATAALTGVWFALSPAPGQGPGGRVTSATALCTLAVSCPICNKIVVGLLGVPGAFAVWAPLQPFLAVASVVIIWRAVLSKRRSSRMTCPVPTPALEPPLPDPAAEPGGDVVAASHQ